MAKKLINQPTAAPTRKLTAAAGWGFLSSILVFTVQYWAPGVPETLTQYIPLGVSLVAGYFTRERA